MSKQYFQVNVEQATPACDCNCPNLKIDVDDQILEAYLFDNKQTLIDARRIHCVNDTYCRMLYEKMKESGNKE